MSEIRILKLQVVVKDKQGNVMQFTNGEERTLPLFLQIPRYKKSFENFFNSCRRHLKLDKNIIYRKLWHQEKVMRFLYTIQFATIFTKITQSI